MREKEEIMSTTTFLEEVRQSFGKVFHERFKEISPAILLLVNVRENLEI